VDRFSSGGSRSGLGAGLLSGLLCALALPPFGLWPLVFIGLVPLALVCARSGRGRAPAVRAGIAFGAAYHGLLLHWVPWTLQGMVSFGALSGGLLIVTLAGVGGLQGAGLRALVAGKQAGRQGRALLFAIPAVWTGTELLLAQAGPLAFPWLPLGLALTAVPALAGVAELGGSFAVTLWIAGVNGGVAAFVVVQCTPGSGPLLRGRPVSAPPPRPLLFRGAALLFLALTPAAWGAWRATVLPVETLPSVWLVQMDLPREALLVPGERDRLANEALDRLLVPGTAEPGDDPVLVILPEAPFSEPWGPALESRMVAHADRLGIPVLMGVHAPMDGVSGDRANAVLLVSPDGDTEMVHAKRHLVPGVEWPGLATGAHARAWTVNGLRVGFLICFEASFGSAARRLVADGAELLVNPSNDGWFRPVIGSGRSAAHAQQRGHLILRAVEGRVGVVRSPIGGELLVIDPGGRILHSRPPGSEGSIVIRPSTSSLKPLSAGMGDLIAVIGSLLLALAAVVSGRSRLSFGRGVISGRAPG